MKRKLIVIIMVLAAMALGVFAQRIAFVLHGIIAWVPSNLYLSLFTVLSISLFITSLYIMNVWKRNGEIDRNTFYILFPTTLTLTAVTSAWSMAVVLVSLT